MKNPKRIIIPAICLRIMKYRGVFYFQVNLLHWVIYFWSLHSFLYLSVVQVIDQAPTNPAEDLVPFPLNPVGFPKTLLQDKAHQAWELSDHIGLFLRNNASMHQNYKANVLVLKFPPKHERLVFKYQSPEAGS